MSAQTTAKTSLFNTKNHSPSYNKNRNLVDDYDYTTAMRYGKIPERGEAKNPYSESHPFPKPEITSEKLRPGYREDWLRSLESKFVPKVLESGKKSGERSQERKSMLVTPIKDTDNFFGDKSTAIKTSTIKRTTTTTTKELTSANDRPRTSKFDVGLSGSKTFTESQVVSNKIF